MEKLRKIIREELYKVINEIGFDKDPVKVAQDIVKSNEEQIKNIELELKFRQNDARVSGLPPEEKQARIEAMKVAKERLEAAKAELELSRQAEINAVQMQQQAQASSQESQTQDASQSQIQSQT